MEFVAPFSDQHLLEKVLEDAYPRMSHPLENDEFSLASNIINAIDAEIDNLGIGSQRTKSPGLPWMHLYATNEDFISQNRELFFIAVCTRFIDLMSQPFPHEMFIVKPDLGEEFPSALDLVRDNACDPVRVFIKNEPHSKSKCDTGKFRLIFNVSTIDLVVERLLFTPWLKLQIQNWTMCPSLPGIGFDDVKYQQTLELMQRTGEFYANKAHRFHGKVAFSDVTGMDWTVDRYGITSFTKTFNVCCGFQKGLNVVSALGHLAYVRSYCFAKSMLVFSDGAVVLQLIPGVVKSGAMITSGCDSYVRVRDALMVGLQYYNASEFPPASKEMYLTKFVRSTHAMGDDCFEPCIEYAPEFYRRINVNLKEYETKSLDDEFDFCGHVYSRISGPKLFRVDKAIAKLLSKTYTNLEQQHETINGLFKELRNQPEERERINTILDEVGWWLH